MSHRWQVYLRLGRVSNLPTVWTNCLAGTMLAGGGFDGLVFFPAALGTSMLYVAGMYLNDGFDREFDARHRPERPIPSGEISPGAVFAIAAALMAAGAVVIHLPSAYLGGRIQPEAALWTLALAALIVYYNYRHKGDPLSPLVMALCRAMVYLIAAAIASTAIQGPVLAGASVLAAYLIGLTYAAKQETLGRIRNVWPLAFLAAPFLYHAAAGSLLAPVAALAWTGLLAWVLYNLGFLIQTRRRSIPRAVVGLIAGISLLDALAIAAGGARIEIVAVAVAGFGLTLLFQRYVPGT